jgi:hypothetical protein
MNLAGVVQQLTRERDRAQSEVERLDATLAALGNLDGTNRVRVGGQTRSVAPLSYKGCLDYKCRHDNQELLRETEKWIQIKFCLVADRVSKQIAFTRSCSFLASSMAREILIGVLSGFVPVSCSSAARRF